MSWHFSRALVAASRFLGMDDGMADRVGRIRTAGNGQVPGVAAMAWRILTHNV